MYAPADEGRLSDIRRASSEETAGLSAQTCHTDATKPRQV
jgi:hypothetical protein